MAVKKKTAPPARSGPAWHQTYGTMIAGEAAKTELDLVASAMESKWGADRLRLLVGVELREKFDRQRYLVNQALWHGDLEDVRRETSRMVVAWKALDRAASQAGAEPLVSDVWEVALEDGTVAAIVRDNAAAASVHTAGRALRIFTLDEVARLIQAFPEIIKAKAAFPGASVEKVRRDVSDSLNAIPDTELALDDEIPF